MRIKIQIFENCTFCKGMGEIPAGYILGTLSTISTKFDNTYPEMKPCDNCKGKGKFFKPQLSIRLNLLSY